MQNIIQLASVKNRVWQWLCRMSDWVDEHWFPVPAGEPVNKWHPLHEQQAKVEEACKTIRAILNNSTSLDDIRRAQELIKNMRRMYGPTTQVDAAVDSLLLDVMNRSSAIIKAL